MRVLDPVKGDAPMALIKNEDGTWNEASPVLGHRADGTPWEGVQRGTSYPQPAPALPHHHTPTKPPPGTRYPNPNTKAGYPAFTALLYEDEEIRVFENRIISGILGPKHSHDDDYWLVTAHRTPSPAKMTAQQEHPSPKNNWKLATVSPMEGSVVFIQKGHTETADNPPDSPTCILYAVEIKEGGSPKAGTPPGWGASSAVLYENTEVRIQDLTIPPGQTGQAPLLDSGVAQIFHVDVAGQRAGGAMSVPQLRAPETGNTGMGRKKFGTTYNMKPTDAGAGQATNETNERYRGVVIEVKDVEPVLTARL